MPDARNESAIPVVGFDGKGVSVVKSQAAAIVARKGKGKKRQKKEEAIVGVSYNVDSNERTLEQAAENLFYPDKKGSFPNRVGCWRQSCNAYVRSQFVGF
jgi:hypothetical protein